MNLRSLIRGRKFLKLLKRLMVGQAVPEIPLSVGSKLELLRAFVLAEFPYTSPYTHAFVRVCILWCIIIIVVYTRTSRAQVNANSYSCIQCTCMTEAPRVLHFSAFIHNCRNACWHIRIQYAITQFQQHDINIIP